MKQLEFYLALISETLPRREIAAAARSQLNKAFGYIAAVFMGCQGLTIWSSQALFCLPIELASAPMAGMRCYGTKRFWFHRRSGLGQGERSEYVLDLLHPLIKIIICGFTWSARSRLALWRLVLRLLRRQDILVSVTLRKSILAARVVIPSCF
jgi:hypothetical protein